MVGVWAGSFEARLTTKLSVERFFCEKRSLGERVRWEVGKSGAQSQYFASQVSALAAAYGCVG